MAENTIPGSFSEKLQKDGWKLVHNVDGVDYYTGRKNNDLSIGLFYNPETTILIVSEEKHSQEGVYGKEVFLGPCSSIKELHTILRYYPITWRSTDDIGK